MFWPIVWSLVMTALVVATVVVALLEKKAANKARAELAPQPLEAETGFSDPVEDGFGETDPVDSFGFDDQNA